MSGPAVNPQWYLARDGQQFGPISEAEMAKLVELGHLQPTDLLWRDGFPDWRPAMVVFPPHGLAQPRAPMRGPPAGPAARPADELLADPAPTGRRSARGQEMADEERRPRRGARVVALLLLVALLAGAAGAGYVYRDRLTSIATSLAASLSASSGAMDVADRKSLEMPPLVGFRAGSVDAIDATLQNTALWRVIKREFPDWYTERLNEGAALARDNKDDAVIGQLVARKLVELRRQQVANGLSAKLPMLKTVASAYYDSLTRLRKYNPEACSGFIKQGEAEPLIVALLQGSDQTAHLQALATVVFEAIADGRQVPRVHPRPSPAQYEMLANELTKRGWTQADFQLLTSKQGLAQAEPDKVCQLVQEFFGAQLALPDAEVQMRLLVDSLRPVFAG
jgi:GYF domain 2